MPKFILFSLTMLLVVNPATNSENPLAKYRKVEAYEIRPGILAMPRYSQDNEVCEVGLEKLHYTPELIRVDSTLSQEEIDQTLDELASASERGERSKDPLDRLIVVSGSTQSRTMDFENVRVEIYGVTDSSSPKRKTSVTEVAATIKWKKRACR